MDNIHESADFVASDLEAASKSFFERFSECSVTPIVLMLRSMADSSFFDFTRVLRLRSRVFSSSEAAEHVYSSSEASKSILLEF